MYDIEITLNGDVIQVLVNGQQSVETDIAIDHDIREACRHYGVERVLVDIRGLDGRLNLLRNHEAAKSFRQRMAGAVRKMAIVELAEYQRNSEMFELTARNRGMFVRFFETVSAAESWLKSG